MTLVRRSLGLGEQIFASAFTFLVLVAASRLLSPEGLSVYTAFFSLNQSFAFFLMGLVLLPLASSTGADTERQLWASLILLVLLLAGFALVAPLAMLAFDSFDPSRWRANWALSLVFFCAHCLFETARWLSIRLRGARPVFAVTAARLLLFFGGLFLLGLNGLKGAEFVLLHSSVNGLAVLGYLLVLRPSWRRLRPDFSHFKSPRHFAIFGNSLANFATNLTVVALLERAWGGAGLAAFQALRSATNPVGLISQFIDNHFTASLARNPQKLAFGAGLITLALSSAALLLVLSLLLAPMLTAWLLGADFVQWWPVLPLMLFASLAHAMTRPVFVQWRLAGDVRMLNAYSCLVLLGVAPVIAVLGGLTTVYAMLLIFAAQPLVALLVQRFRPFLTTAAAS